MRLGKRIRWFRTFVGMLIVAIAVCGIVLPQNIVPVLSLPAAQAAETLPGYTVTFPEPTGQYAPYKDPVVGRYTLATTRELNTDGSPTGRYYTMSVSDSDLDSGVNRYRRLYITVFETVGGSAQIVQSSSIPLGDYITVKRPGMSDTVRIEYQVRDSRTAGGAYLIRPENGALRFSRFYDYNPYVKLEGVVASVADNVPRILEQTTYFYEVGTTNPVRPEYVQSGLLASNYATAPVDVPGWTLVSPFPVNQNGIISARQGAAPQVGDVHYFRSRTQFGMFWLRLQFTDVTYGQEKGMLSGYFRMCDGTHAGQAEAYGACPADIPERGYDFEANPDNLPIIRGREVTPYEAQNNYVPIHFALRDASGKPINRPVLQQPTEVEWVFPVGAPARLPLEGGGRSITTTLYLAPPSGVVYYYARPKFSIKKETSDQPAVIRSDTTSVVRTYQVTVSNTGSMEGTTQAIYDIPSTMSGFTITSVSVDGQEISQDAPDSGRYLLSDGVALNKDESKTYTVQVTYAVNLAELSPDGLERLGQCQVGENPQPSLGFYNAVEMDNDEDGPANNNACTTGSARADMSWEKTDGSGTPLVGSTFRLYADADVIQLPGTSGYVTVRDCVFGSCPAESTGLNDRDPRPGYFLIKDLPVPAEDAVLPYLRETVAPKGYEKIANQLSFDFSLETLTYRLKNVTSGDGERPLVEDGQVRNYLPESEISWQKVDPQGQPLAGSEWQIAGGQLTAPLNVRDCVAQNSAGCSEQTQGNTYYDVDNRAGYFRMKLPHSSNAYTLRETKAPAGYVLSDTVYTFTVPVKSADIVNGKNIVNRQISVPQIPFTGGTGSDLFFIAGGIFVVVAATSEYARRRNRRKKMLLNE